ncbi:hypothetical protein MTO96_035668 [Rhipicephalus appendiculatus]
MISTSKIRRPPSVLLDERRKLRRVSFLESSTGDATEGTVGNISESTIWKSREELRPTRSQRLQVRLPVRQRQRQVQNQTFNSVGVASIPRLTTALARDVGSGKGPSDDG